MIRPARELDHPRVREVVTAAFGRADEADLVDRLRSDGDVLVELVAERSAEIVGHVLFSKLALVGEADTVPGAALAPVSVIPAHQGRGAGSALIQAGIDACRDQGLGTVVVLGHPDYYPRFGFSAELARRVQAPFSGPSFMAFELTPGVLKAPYRARYAPAFGLE